MSIDYILAKQLFEKGTILGYKHNSVFTAMDEYGVEVELVRAATVGLANEVKADINLYRNTILPVTKDFEIAVKTKAKTTAVTIADKVSIHTSQYQTGLDTFEELQKIDTKVISTTEALPVNPLIIEYDKAIVRGNVTNNRIRESMDMLMLEYTDSYLEELHTKVFSNVSRNNGFLQDLGLNPVANYNDIYLCLVMVTGYIEGTLGVSNTTPNQARNLYLYTLRDVLVTYLANYRSLYKIYLEREVLISKVRTTDKGQTHVYLVGEIYTKYLDDQNVDPIIGYASKVGDSSRVSLTVFLESIDTYTEYYENSIRIASMRSALDNINVLRLAYKLVARDYLDNLTDGQLDGIGLDHEALPVINKMIETYVDGLSSEKLLDLTVISRTIVSVHIYNNIDFMVFVGYMAYYNKLFPKLSVEEIATTAMVAHMMDKLEPQLANSVVQ